MVHPGGAFWARGQLICLWNGFEKFGAKVRLTEKGFVLEADKGKLRGAIFFFQNYCDRY